ncbi:MAG: hypothetical protein ACETWG_10660 [Candidatus Neomarinimicrobiota bacterium]
MKRILTLSTIAVVTLFLSGCAPSRAVLTLSDLDPKLAFLEEHGIYVALIDYPVTGIEKYNEFFKSSALIYYTAELAGSMVNDATANLKRFARDRLAGAVMDENIRELIGDTPPDQLSVEQSLAVMRMEQERDRITQHEVEYFATTIGELGIASFALVRGIKETPDLIRSGGALLTNVKDDFTIFGIPRFWEIRPVVEGLNESIDRLKHVRDKAPVIVEDIAVLISGIKELSG